MPHRIPRIGRFPRSYRARFSIGPISSEDCVHRKKRSRRHVHKARCEVSVGKPDPLVELIFAARLGKIVSLMRAAAFSALKCAHRKRLRRIEPTPQFKPLDEARIVNPFGRHGARLQTPLAHGTNAIERIAESVGSPERTNFAPHHFLDLGHQTSGGRTLSGVLSVDTANQLYM